MKPSVAVRGNREAIRSASQRNRTTNPRVFGSVLSGTDAEGSDLDILVDPLPGATLLDLGALREELQELLGVNVDVLTPKDLPLRFREDVLAQARAV